MVLTLGFSDVLEHVLPYRYFGIPVNILGWHLMFWFTNYTVMMLIASIGMLIIFPKFFGKVYTDAPTGWKNVFEYMLEFMREDVLRPVLKDHTDEFLPFLWTLFFFIMFCNFLGLLPLAQVIGLATGGHLQHMGGSPTSAFTMTATLAFIAFIFIHLQGLYQLNKKLRNGTYGHHGHGEGHGHESHGHAMSAGEALVRTVPIYLWNFAPHPFADKGFVADIAMFVPLLLLELIGAVVKPFALCMRLFGNMISGHLVIGVLIGLIVMVPLIIEQVGVAIPILPLDILIQLLEVLVVFLHAYIFTLLTAIFIAGAVAPEH